MLFAFEVGDDAADGVDTGGYLELGVAPGHTYDNGLSLSVPLTLGLSLYDYYEVDNDDDVFGYFDIGLVAEYPLPIDESWGAWTLSAGIHGLFLGDNTESINGGDSAEVIGHVGIALSF